MNAMGKLKKVIYFFAIVILFSISTFALAQTVSQTTDEKAQLQQQLDSINSQIAEFQKQLNEIKGQKNTLQNKIKQLQKKQAALNLQIQAATAKLAGLQQDLNKTEGQITETEQKIVELRKQLSQYLRLVNERDRYPFVYIVVAKNNLSDLASEITAYRQMSEGLRSLAVRATKLNQELASHKTNLIDQQEETGNYLSIQALAKNQISASVSEQDILLKETKGRENDYQITINDTQKRANEIRSRLYQLLGVSSQITFGEAAKIAQWVSDQTAVRAAFLLAILTQESNLGKNVGTCNRPGDPPEKFWKVVMKPTRDQEPFLQITSELGMDPDITPVSCPMKDSKGRQVGWGGAMGPAQFIPSTWMGYKDKVSAMTGKPANPWDIRDAFIAAGIKLQAGGAGTQEGEWAAAMRYFSGGTNTKYRFYGDNVVALAEQYQADLDALNK